MKESITQFYNKRYKLILIVPAIILLIALSIIAHTYFTTGDFIHRDVSLTGGTTITILSSGSASALTSALSSQFPDLEVRSLSDNTGKQTQLVLTTSATPDQITPALESYLGYKLSDKNSSVESTGSNLSKDFYQQLLIAILIAFFWMAAVVFVIFTSKWKIRILAIILNILFGIFVGKIFLTLNIYFSSIILLVFAFTLVFIYIKYSTPSFAVMSCAFADIVMTLAAVDLMGMKISGAGIVAFLMLIGYSVDTDILLTTRVLRRKGTSINSEIFGAFKTGMTMTLTAIAAVAVALFFVYSFQTALNQIFTILLIGLTFDIFNTWITNTSLIKWFVESKSAGIKI
jgi:preprotein translocase subunit SecF